MPDGIRVTVTDLATGESESAEITDDFIIVTAGNHYVAGRQHWPKSGTTTLTIKCDAQQEDIGGYGGES